MFSVIALKGVSSSMECVSHSLHGNMCKKDFHMCVFVSLHLMEELCQITGVISTSNLSVSTFPASSFHITLLGLH